MQILILIIINFAFVAWIFRKGESNKNNINNQTKEDDKKKSHTPNYTNDKNLKRKITKYLERNKIKYWSSEDKTIFRVGYDLEKHGKYDMFIFLNNDHLTFNGVVMQDIGDQAVSRAAEIVTRINEHYVFGHLNFYYEKRIIIFRNEYIYFENPLSENKFNMYLDTTINGAVECRELVSTVVNDGEEPIIAMMNLADN